MSKTLLLSKVSLGSGQIWLQEKDQETKRLLAEELTQFGRLFEYLVIKHLGSKIFADPADEV
jgi:hypothetical protein